MKFSIQLLCLVILSALALSAGETPSMAVENLQLDKENDTVTFDVKALSAKPIHSWTATVVVSKKEPNLPEFQETIRWTSSSCSLAYIQSQAKNCFHCALSVAAGNAEASPVSAEAEITAVLFEDGTSEGDIEYLNQLSANRHAIFLTFDYWLTSFRQIRSSGSPAEQLGSFARLLAAPDSAAPSGLVLGRNLYPAWEDMRKLVSDALRRVENGSAAEIEANALEKRLEIRGQMAKKGADAFPWHANISAQARVPETADQIQSHAFNLKILKTERRSGRLVAYVRNDYLAEIAGYVVGDGDGKHDVTTMSGGGAIGPGETFEIQAPVPRDNNGQGTPLEILCVVFKDRTGDGDRAKIEELNEHWAGRRWARAAFAPKLHAMAAAPESEIASTIEKLADELQKEAPEAEARDRSPQFIEGMHMERIWVSSVMLQDLRQLRHLSKGEAQVKQSMMELAEKLDRQ